MSVCGSANNYCAYTTNSYGASGNYSVDYGNLNNNDYDAVTSLPADIQVYTAFSENLLDTTGGPLQTETITGSTISVNENTIYANCIFEGENGVVTFNIQNCTATFTGCTFPNTSNFNGGNCQFTSNFYVYLNSNNVFGGGTYSQTLQYNYNTFNQPTILLQDPNVVDKIPTMNFSSISYYNALLYTVFNTTFTLNTPGITTFDVYFSGDSGIYTVTANSVDVITTPVSESRGASQSGIARGFMNINKHSSIKKCKIKINNRVQLIKT